MRRIGNGWVATAFLLAAPVAFGQGPLGPTEVRLGAEIRRETVTPPPPPTLSHSPWNISPEIYLQLRIRSLIENCQPYEEGDPDVLLPRSVVGHPICLVAGSFDLRSVQGRQGPLYAYRAGIVVKDMETLKRHRLVADVVLSTNAPANEGWIGGGRGEYPAYEKIHKVFRASEGEQELQVFIVRNRATEVFLYPDPGEVSLFYDGAR